MTAADDAIDAVPRPAQEALLAWYEASGRSLAFRATRDPYAVLVSELMAQQTQAARAAVAWTAWMARFPTVDALAASSPADVVRAWAGLGYNRRALMLRRAAQAVVDDHGGRLPDTVDELVTLPGVGPYTARAVAAIAFGIPVGAVDTNVRRVLGRVMAGDSAALAPRTLQQIADASVPADRAGDWTHALMDLGAGPCGSRTPRCEACPISRWCRFAAATAMGLGAAAGAGENGIVPVPPRKSVPCRKTAARRSVPTAVPFASTNRWLRGRIIARAREAEDGAWVGYDEPIGSHSGRAVREAAVGLADDGLLEIRETSAGIEGRLPTK